MQKLSLFPGNRPTMALALFCIVPVFLLLFSCNQEDKKGPDKQLELTATTGLKMNCVVLTRVQVQKWVARGWTDPTKPDSLIKKILLQFYTADAANGNNNMQLVTYPAKNYTTVYPQGEEVARIDSTCVAIQLTGKTTLGNNYISLKRLGILNPNGTLKEFSFIRFRPVQDRPHFDNYVTFTVEVVQVAGDTETIMYSTETDPCPHYCAEEESL